MRYRNDETRGVRGAAVGVASALAVVVALVPSLSGAGQETEIAEARARFEAPLSQGRSAPVAPALPGVLHSLLARDVVAASVYPGEWSKLAPHEQARFRDALSVAMEQWVRDHLGARGVGAEGLAWQRGATDEERVILSYQVETRPGDRSSLDVELISNGEGAWRVVDLIHGGERMTEAYRDRARKVLKDYSLEYMLADLQEADEVVLEDFEAGPVGGLPEGWSWKGSDNKKEKPYTVVEEGGNRFLQARDSGQSVILGKDIPWDLDTYPYVSFRLRVHRIPEGADERNDKTVDSAAGIYFTYRRRFGRIPESVKYVWSSTLPVGAAVIRPGTGRPWQVVVGSGTDGIGEWRTYVFDLRQAYRDTFGNNPPGKTAGIGILSDANSMGGYAWADYDDIRALRSVDGVVGSGVIQIMKHTR